MKKATFPTMAGNPPADGAQPSGIPPPPIRYEVAPPPPSEVGYVWTQGYWAPYEGHYVWCPGRWVRQPYEGVSWRGVQWEHGDHGWRYHEGYWDHHEFREHHGDRTMMTTLTATAMPMVMTSTITIESAWRMAPFPIQRPS